jgi:hypothetical protein
MVPTSGARNGGGGMVLGRGSLDGSWNQTDEYQLRGDILQMYLMFYMISEASQGSGDRKKWVKLCIV